MAGRKSTPCQNCPNKGCGKYHSLCEPYLAWVLQKQEERTKRFEEQRLLNDLYTKPKKDRHRPALAAQVWKNTLR